MIGLARETLDAIRAHAADEMPRECCGLVVVVRGRERYVRCQNIGERADHFAMEPLDLARAEEAGDVLAVVHSHPDASPRPSEADRVGCEQSGWPWVIVGWPADRWERLAPCGYRAPLIGRPWAHGILDCYSLVRDWYARELGIALPDYPRTDGWWERGEDLYRRHYREAGFERVAGTPQRHDVLLMRVQARQENHAAIYLGGTQILHHLHERLSSREVYGGYWQKHTTAVLRHRTLCRRL